MSQSECYFAIDIKAPKGLAGIDRFLHHCDLPLHAWKSGYNGEYVLRSDRNELIDWNMDAVNDEIKFASGTLFTSAEQADRHLRSLSKTLSLAGFAHQILLDDTDGDLYQTIEHNW